MDAKLQGIKIKPVLCGDDELAIEHRPSGNLLIQKLNQFREVPIERFAVTTLNQYVVFIPEDDGSKAIPLRLKDPMIAAGHSIDAFGQHGQKRRSER